MLFKNILKNKLFNKIKIYPKTSLMNSLKYKSKISKNHRIVFGKIQINAMANVQPLATTYFFSSRIIFQSV